MSVEYYKKQIDSCLQQPEYVNSVQGIIIVVGMFGAAGTAVDSSNVQNTFKELGFAVLPVQDPTSESLANLMKAASQYEYPKLKRFRFFAFYFAGHGGMDGNGDLFVNTAAESDDVASPILHIEQYIIEPVKDLSTPYRIFLFDCCQSPNEGQAYRDKRQGKPVTKRAHQVVAHAVSKGQKAVGKKDEGGVWTCHLCTNIRQQIPLVNVLAKTNGAVQREGFQDPSFFCNIDDVIVAKSPPKETSSSPLAGGIALKYSPKPPTADASDSYTTLKDPVDALTAFRLIKSHSSYWEDIGRSLGLTQNDRDVIRQERASVNIRLEAVLNQWIERQRTPRWMTLVTALSEAGLFSLADSIQTRCL